MNPNNEDTSVELASLKAQVKLLSDRVRMAEEIASLNMSQAGDMTTLSELIGSHIQARSHSKHLVSVAVLQTVYRTLQKLAESENEIPTSVITEVVTSLKEVLDLLLPNNEGIE